jgi:hypothetical protein
MPVGILYGNEWFAGAELIVTGWTALAGFAWGNYLEAGRGVVWLPRDADQAANGPLYVPATRPSLLADRSAIIRRLRTDLERYKPDREFVIFFTGAKDDKAYRAGKIEDFEAVLRPQKGQPRPPEALEFLQEAERRGVDLASAVYGSDFIR